VSLCLEAGTRLHQVTRRTRDDVVVAPAELVAAGLTCVTARYDFLSNIPPSTTWAGAARACPATSHARRPRPEHADDAGLQALPAGTRSGSRSTTTFCRSSRTAAASGCRRGSTTASPPQRDRSLATATARARGLRHARDQHRRHPNLKRILMDDDWEGAPRCARTTRSARAVRFSGESSGVAPTGRTRGRAPIYEGTRIPYPTPSVLRRRRSCSRPAT